MDFVKYSAQGNDYIVIDPNKVPINFNSQWVRKICDRRTGIGADGVLYGPHLVNGKLGLEVYNSDGSACGKSGNGLRVFSRYLVDNDYVQSDSFNIWLIRLAQSVAVQRLPAHNQFLVSLGSFCLESKKVPVIMDKKKTVLNEPLHIAGKDMSISCVDIGNPHCVVFGQPANRATAELLGPPISQHSMFPNKTNVQFVNIVDPSCIEVETWERGSGYTLASGSSACAAAAVCHTLGLVDADVTVVMPGGRMSVFIDPDSTLNLVGSVAHVFSGMFSYDFEKGMQNV
ncbi:DapF: diaminopimelate epimerase [Pseudomonas koreensis]|uniref:Diaminopimelate epimerase n=2 Tax=Pseudomonas TaxID=286 RepID=A0AA94EI98_9PSED|nr:DapF: diaminopimelate epimerase [Pseudomonas koreensis]